MEAMPMFCLASIVGIPGLVVQQVERKRDIPVWAKPAERASCPRCATPAMRIEATYQRTRKHTRQGNRRVVPHLSAPKHHCTGGNCYFRHPFAGIRARLRSTETYRLEVFEAHDGDLGQRKRTHPHRIGSATVEPKSNGITEGFPTKMERLSRPAYGFRNFENTRMRVLAQCGWNGGINRV